MKKILWCTVFLLLFLSGCAKSDEAMEPQREEGDLSDAADAFTQTDTSEYDTAGENMAERSSQWSANGLSPQENPYNGEQQYVSFYGEDIVYAGDPIELGMSVEIAIQPLDNDRIPLLCMVLIDGQPVPFSLGTGEADVVQYTELQNGEQAILPLLIEPENISQGETKQLLFVGIPFYDKADNGSLENDILSWEHNLYAQAEAAGGEPAALGRLTVLSEDDVEELYAADVHEIFPDREMIRDCIMQNKEGDWYYLGGYEQGRGRTYLICDGLLFDGFPDGQYSILWEDETEGYGQEKIDISSLAEGSHLLTAFTVEYGQSTLWIKKSVNREVVIE